MTDPTLTTATPDEPDAVITQLGGVLLSTDTLGSTGELVLLRPLVPPRRCCGRRRVRRELKSAPLSRL